MNEDIKYLSISELNRIIKMKFDASSFFNKVFIKGEISNFKVQMPSGHCYFTIKDEGSRLSAVMFRGVASKVGTNFKDGDMVNAIGKISVYEASGSYQIYIESMELNGSGDLYKKFLELKDKLFKEGLFDENHNRLGYGGGFYDKFLSDKNIYKIKYYYSQHWVRIIYYIQIKK